MKLIIFFCLVCEEFFSAGDSRSRIDYNGCHLPLFKGWNAYEETGTLFNVNVTLQNLLKCVSDNSIKSYQFQIVFLTNGYHGFC